MKFRRTAPSTSSNRVTSIFMPADDDDKERMQLAEKRRYLKFKWIAADIPKRSITEAVSKSLPDELDHLLSSTATDEVNREVRSNLLLHEAVKNSTPSILRHLLDHVKPEVVSLKNADEKTALHLAVELVSLDCCEAIMSKRPDSLMDGDKMGNTPVHYIAKKGFMSACEKAIQYGSSRCLNVMNFKHEMPAHVAAIENRKQILQLLLENNAKVDAKTKQNYTPLHFACDNGNADCVKIIINSVQDLKKRNTLVNSRTKSKATALTLAASKGFRSCCVELLGADVDAVDSNGSSALHYAARKGYYSLVEFLLEKQADVKLLDNNKQSALYHAACSTNENCLELLLKHSVTIDNAAALELLRAATKKNNDACLRILFKHDNFVSLINHAPRGNSLLHISLKKGNYQVSRLLLEMGADKNICNENGEFPLHLAAEQSKLKSRVAEEDRQFVCKTILQSCHDLVHKVNHNNQTPLHLAAKSGNTEMVRSLIKKGSKILAKDHRNYTSIHLAAEHGHEETLKRLLKDIFAGNYKELEEIKPHPLHVAAQNGHLDCCKLMCKDAKLKRGLTTPDATGLFPVDFAYKNRKFNTFRYLLTNMNVNTDLHDFCLRLHDYCEKSILEKRQPVFEAVIESSWHTVAFNGYYCNNLHYPQYGIRPCHSFARLSKFYPDFACKLMDKLITKPSNESLKEVHNYSPFEFIYYNKSENGRLAPTHESKPPYNIRESAKAFPDVVWGRDHPLLEASVSEDPRILNHKLTKSWLNHKFNSYSKWILYAYVSFDLLTAICVTTFISLLSNFNNLLDDYSTNEELLCNAFNNSTLLCDFNSTNSNTALEDCIKASNCSAKEVCPPCAACVRDVMTESYHDNCVMAATVIVLILLLIHLALEVVFIRIYKARIHYSLSFGLSYIFCLDFLRIIRLICITAVLIPHGGYSFSCSFQLGTRHIYQWLCGIVGVLVVWMCFIRTINKIPSFSVLMPYNKKFFLSYMKVILYIFILIGAFSICFYFLLPHKTTFKNPLYAFVQTLVWMLGDLGYDDSFQESGCYELLFNTLFIIFVLGIGSLVYNMVISSSMDILGSIKKKSSFYHALDHLMLQLLIDDCIPYYRKKHSKFRRDITNEVSQSTITSSVFYSDPPTKHGPGVNSDVADSVDLCEDSPKNSAEMFHLILKKLQAQNDEFIELSRRVNDMKSQLNAKQTSAEP